MLDAGTALLASGSLTFECVSEEEATFLYEEIFERQVYEQHGVSLRCPCARNDDDDHGVIVDAGANIGLFALRCASQRARVLSVEPISAVFEVLRRNTADHAHLLSVRAALGATERAEVAIAHVQTCPGESTRYPAERAEMRRVLAREAKRARVAHLCPTAVATDQEVAAWPLETCEQLTVSSLLRAHAAAGARVHLLKVDVEGDELEVLRGVDARDWPRICQCVVEVHDVEDVAAPAAAGSEPADIDAKADAATLRRWPGDVPACGPRGRLARVVQLLRDEARFARVHVVRQRPETTRGFLSFVPEALNLFHVFATRAEAGAGGDGGVANGACGAARECGTAGTTSTRRRKRER
jgi:FkbM family methyltransferase